MKDIPVADAPSCCRTVQLSIAHFSIPSVAVSLLQLAERSRFEAEMPEEATAVKRQFLWKVTVRN